MKYHLVTILDYPKSDSISLEQERINQAAQFLFTISRIGK